MEIHQIYTANELRNFTYIIELNNSTAIVIDPWDAVKMSQYLDSKKLSLTAIINTHEHWDHTQGNEDLVKRYNCEVWAHKNGMNKIPQLSRALNADEVIDLDNNCQLRVLDTPGHTFAHLCFMVLNNAQPIAVFTGDTLFNAGVGHCRSGGNEETLFNTISQHFQHLPNNVVVYPGHDYLENNLRFTLAIEPQNKMAKTWLEKVQTTSYQAGSIQTTIGDERCFNTFMRLDNPDIIEHLKLKKAEAKQVFIALRNLRDHW